MGDFLDEIFGLFGWFGLQIKHSQSGKNYERRLELSVLQIDWGLINKPHWIGKCVYAYYRSTAAKLYDLHPPLRLFASVFVVLMWYNSMDIYKRKFAAYSIAIRFLIERKDEEHFTISINTELWGLFEFHNHTHLLTKVLSIVVPPF